MRKSALINGLPNRSWFLPWGTVNRSVSRRRMRDSLQSSHHWQTVKVILLVVADRKMQPTGRTSQRTAGIGLSGQAVVPDCVQPTRSELMRPTDHRPCHLMVFQRRRYRKPKWRTRPRWQWKCSARMQNKDFKSRESRALLSTDTAYSVRVLILGSVLGCSVLIFLDFRFRILDFVI